jgi:predicted sugar kinase
MGFKGIAQSSWGPTGCVFSDSEQNAMKLVENLHKKIKNSQLKHQELEILVAKANNSGAIIDSINL